MNNIGQKSLWSEVSEAARETPRLYIRGAKEIVDAFGRWVRPEVRVARTKAEPERRYKVSIRKSVAVSSKLRTKRHKVVEQEYKKVA